MKKKTKTSATRQRKKRGPQGPAVNGGSRSARQRAAAILEVLGGLRTPADAAAALGLSTARYYLLEKRAIGWMVRACEAVKPGKQRSAAQQIRALEQQVQRLETERSRNLALLRSAQRAIGLSAPRKEADGKGKKKKRKRRPVARGLKAAQRLQSAAPEPTEPKEPTPRGVKTDEPRPTAEGTAASPRTGGVRTREETPAGDPRSARRNGDGR